MNHAAVPSTLRRINRRLILRHLMQVPLADRGELAAVANTSQVTAGRIVDELLGQGVLEPAEARRDSTRPGRPGQALRLNSKESRFILVQLGVRQTRVAFVPLLMDGGGEEKWPVEFITPETAKAWEEKVAGAIASLKLETPKSCWGVLVCVPGMVNEAAGRVRYSPNLHYLESIDFRAMLAHVSAPVELVHEIRALALGHQAAAPGEGDFMLVDFGQGVGGAAIINGTLHQTTLPMAGELGHIPIRGNARKCGCGAIGCMETLMSRRRLMESFREHHPEFKLDQPDPWSAFVKHVNEQPLEAWLADDLAASAAVMAGALNVLGLARIVITGSPMEFPENVQDFIAGRIRESALWARFGEVSVTFAPRRRMRGMISVGVDRLLVDSASE